MHPLTSKTLDVLPELPNGHWSRGTSSLSSTFSIARQVTLFTEQHAHTATKKAFAAHLAPGLTRRQASEPLQRNASHGMRRTSSWPAMPTFQTVGEIGQLVDERNCAGSNCTEEEDSGSDALSLESETSRASSYDDFRSGDSPITRAVLAAVDRCNSSLAVATPGGAGLTAVSKKLAAITGYTCEALLSFGAEDCPALTHTLDDEVQREAFRQALETGANFASLFVSRKQSGDIFLNAVHVRGLTLARAGRDGEEEGDFWILLMAFADVTGWDRQHLPSDHSMRLDKLARRIQKYVNKEMAENGFENAFDSSGDGLRLMSTFTWKSGCSGAPGPRAMMDKFALRSDIVGLLGVSAEETKSDNAPPIRTGETPCSADAEIAHDLGGHPDHEHHAPGTVLHDLMEHGRFPWLSFSVAATVGLAVFLRCRQR